MFLSKITVDARHPQARNDLSSPYEMHRTLSRVFAKDELTPPERFLWRIEPAVSWNQSSVDVLVQSGVPGRWAALQQSGYALQIQADKAVDLLRLVREGGQYRFRLRANPTVTRAGKRYGLKTYEAQHDWLARQGQKFGFEIVTSDRSGNDSVCAHQPRAGRIITVQAVTFDGVLVATDAAALRDAILSGVGHAKSLGLGLLSLAPLEVKWGEV
ncbi:MAG: type I-E CRISPR-associated protein Cas6/Cse3/CasE [Aquabacterium sp.]